MFSRNLTGGLEEKNQFLLLFPNVHISAPRSKNGIRVEKENAQNGLLDRMGMKIINSEHFQKQK